MTNVTTGYSRHLERRVRKLVHNGNGHSAFQLSIGLNAKPSEVEKILKRLAKK